MHDLPEQVILEILIRLPVKSLLRFRCVSKSCFSLISNSHFANLHFERSCQHTQRILYTEVTRTLSSQARSIDFNASLHDDSAVVSLDFPLTIDPYQIEIMGSCRGFLLLLLDYDSKFILWNPSIRVGKQIPPNPLRFDAILHGFGYDAATDDYLILLILQASHDCNAFVCGNHVEIFSLRTNSWNKLDHNYPYISPINDAYPGAGSILDGALHWLALRLGHGTIIAFDLTERNFREVPMPDHFNYKPCELKVVGGFLSLIVKNSHDQSEMWVMREYGVKSSWTRHITLSFAEIHSHYILPICLTKDGQVVVMCGTELMKCNDKGELLECCPQDPQVFDADASVHTESLLSLPTDHEEIKVEDRQW